jgi:hypothetical protein
MNVENADELEHDGPSPPLIAPKKKGEYPLVTCNISTLKA